MQRTKIYQISATALLFTIALFSISTSAFADRHHSSNCASNGEQARHCGRHANHRDNNHRRHDNHRRHARPDTAICTDLGRGARGLCRAAVSSGCATGGRREGARYCERLAENFRRIADEEPVWITQTREPAPALVEDPAPIPDSTTTTTTTTTTDRGITVF